MSPFALETQSGKRTRMEDAVGSLVSNVMTSSKRFLYQGLAHEGVSHRQ